MCCYVSEKSKASLLKRFGKRKTLKLWKHLTPSGAGAFSYYRYSPGEHVATTREDKPWVGSYNSLGPRGIHVYRRKPKSRGWLNTLPVIVRKEDFVCADKDQAVFRKVRILKKDWVAAGLPLEKVRA